MRIFQSKYTLVIAVIFAILTRVAIMGLTYHPDVRATALASYLIVEKGKFLDLYDQFYRPPEEDDLISVFQNLGTQELNSPPLAYFIPSVFRLVLRPLIDKSIDLVVFEQNESLLFSKPEFMLYLILIKSQNLFADLGLAFLLTYFFNQTKDKWKVFLLWMLNPITLYASFAMGQRDIWPTLFTVAAGVLLTRRRYMWASIMLGLGGSYKIFPLLFLVPISLYFGKNIIEKLKILGSGLIVYLTIVLPFAIFSPGYRVMALFAPQTDKMLFAKINVSGDQFLSVFAIGFVALVGLGLFAKKVSWFTIWTGILLLLFSVTHYHPQWFLWITPWFAILWLKAKALRPLIILLMVANLGIVLSFDPSLHYALLGPALPVVREIPYTLPAFIAKFIPFSQAVSLVRSTLAGLGIIFFWRLVNLDINREL
ncbi:MAG: hypothetical protein UW69_C0001G0033 [Microgenomates group bacterium GW2011_GWA2_44_7]|nr:MAG: hypothetical protein UW69_C0001G0033 [Microgenomates group bacterium GW2011_GWA2_44_7]